jgi:hypothetical protein
MTSTPFPFPSGFRAVAVLTLGVAGACGDSTSPEPTPVTPAVTVAPIPNSTGVARSDTVMMTLDMAMDSASCVTRFTLHQGSDTTGSTVPGHVAFTDGYHRMMFVPDGLLEAGTEYFAHMRDSVMVGNRMGGMMTGDQMMMMLMEPPAGAMRVGSGMGWQFTTGS